MLNPGLLEEYKVLFSRLRRAVVNKEKAPHKPILLLSVIQSIAAGEIQENQIKITPELVARFKDNWKWLVPGINFRPNFSLPFYHMISEPFWHLHYIPVKTLLLTSSNSVKSLSNLRHTICFASLDEPLFDLFINAETRNYLYHFLLENYFKLKLPINEEATLVDTIKDQILNDSAISYKSAVEYADEEELFIRSGVFKNLVPRIYDFSCAISRLRIETVYNIQMVDACHIIPFAISHDDTISNGISLSPNFHRAFDRGLVSIGENYEVLISENFSEFSNESQIMKYQGHKILLPGPNNYYPSADSLQWHRNTIFKG